MAEKLTHKDLHDIRLNPFAAELLAESFTKLIAENLGQVGAVEFEFRGVIFSLRHPAHTKIIEGMPAELINAGIIGRFMQIARTATERLNTPTYQKLLEFYQEEKKSDLGFSDELIDMSFEAAEDYMMLLAYLDRLSQAINENDPRFLDPSYVPEPKEPPDALEGEEYTNGNLLPPGIILTPNDDGSTFTQAALPTGLGAEPSDDPGSEGTHDDAEPQVPGSPPSDRV